MRKQAKTLLIYAIGIIFILLGLAAGFIPLVPGIILVFIGFYIISHRSIWIKGKLDGFRSRYPRTHGIVNSFESLVQRVWATIIGICRVILRIK